MACSNDKNDILMSIEFFVWRSPFWYLNREQILRAADSIDSSDAVKTMFDFAIELQRANDLMAEDLRRMYEQSRCFVLSGKVAE